MHLVVAFASRSAFSQLYCGDRRRHPTPPPIRALSPLITAMCQLLVPTATLKL